jgi:hypothetical protein
MLPQKIRSLRVQPFVTILVADMNESGESLEIGEAGIEIPASILGGWVETNGFDRGAGQSSLTYEVMGEKATKQRVE